MRRHLIRQSGDCNARFALFFGVRPSDVRSPGGVDPGGECGAEGDSSIWRRAEIGFACNAA
jgi:hypothetical protein